MIDLKSMTLEELSGFLRSMGEPAFRGRQVFTWLHKGVSSFDEMSNLSKALREKLKEQCILTVPRVAKKQVSARDDQISVADGGWQLCGVRADALPPWKYGMHLFSGGLPDGLCLLCIHNCWKGKKLDTC